MRKYSMLHISMLLSLIAVFIWSFIKPHSMFTWALEVFPAVIVLTVVIITYNKFRLTNIAYFLIWVQAVILFIGGHYTYAREPFFEGLKQVYHLSRNYYDRFGHIAQGFIPAIIIREFFIRKDILRKRGWLSFIVICICMTISAGYELLEFLVAKLTGTAAQAFLGTQGDVWDTQWDMTCALIGSILALLLLRRTHDKEIERLEK